MEGVLTLVALEISYLILLQEMLHTTGIMHSKPFDDVIFDGRIACPAKNTDSAVAALNGSF
jgi:hypothetical protein